MGFRFQRRIRICKGLNINLSKSGIGLSAGVKGARVGVNAKGKPYASVGIAGTGLSYRANLASPSSNQQNIPSQKPSVMQTAGGPQPYRRKEIPIAGLIAICAVVLAVVVSLLAAISSSMSPPAVVQRQPIPVSENRQQPEPLKVYTFQGPSDGSSGTSMPEAHSVTAGDTHSSDYTPRGPDSVPYSVHVNGYYRRNGTYVHSYNRRPRRY